MVVIKVTGDDESDSDDGSDGKILLLWQCFESKMDGSVFCEVHLQTGSVLTTPQSLGKTHNFHGPIFHGSYGEGWVIQAVLAPGQPLPCDPTNVLDLQESAEFSIPCL